MGTLLEIVWLILPASLANMAPVFAARLLPDLSAPVDGGRTLGGIRIFGDHKTIRGMVAGMLLGAVTFALQQALCVRFESLRAISRFDYAQTPWLFGAVLGLGALGGDLVKSFVKRRVGRVPGQSWFPFDQVDWMAGALVVEWRIAHLDAAFAVIALAFAVVASLIIKSLSYRLGLEKRPVRGTHDPIRQATMTCVNATPPPVRDDVRSHDRRRPKMAQPRRPRTSSPKATTQRGASPMQAIGVTRLPALAPPAVVADENHDPRRRMIAEAAYFRALGRGFHGGDSDDDWYVAEREIDARVDRHG